MNVGYRDVDNSMIVLAFEPKSIHFVVTSAISNIKSIGKSLNELKELLENSIKNNSLIMVSWG